MTVRRWIGVCMIVVGVISAIADWVLIYPGLTLNLDRPGYAAFVILTIYAVLFCFVDANRYKEEDRK